MKKYFLFLLSAILGISAVNATVSELQNGYYRVSNHVSNRYIQVMDNKGKLNTSAATADMRAIVLIKDKSKVVSDPATVLYLEKHGGQFDIQAQSTGIYQMISTYLNLMDSPTVPGSYWAYGKKGSVIMYLYDAFTSLTRETSFLNTSGEDNMRDWDITPIEANSDNYFGVAPRIQIGGKYYEPFFADFPFSPASNGIKAYYITKVDEKNACVVYKEITGTVPRSTPCFIECSSDQPINNKLNVGGNANAIADNVATGVYFEFELNQHDNYVVYDKSKMRSLGVLSDGSLGVVTGDYKYVPRNTFYIPVSSTAPAQMKLVTEQEYEAMKEPVYPTGITLSSTSLTLTIGDSQTLTATVQPDDTTDKTLTWSTSNASVATVDNSGKISAVGVGSATITVKCQNVTATCQVTVKGIQATSVTLSSTALDLKVGATQTLTATVAPDNTTDKTITWTTSNAAVATVNNGVVTAVAPGTATISAKCGDVTATCQVTVTAIEVTSVTLSANTLSLHIGDTQTLTANVAPENATYKTVTWTTSNASVASVDNNGKVTALAVGTATITAKAGEVTATCQVTVSPVDVTSLTINATALDLHIGEATTLTATVAPANATDKTVTWTTSNASVATVDANGKVTALTLGEATITAKAGNCTATCVVNVRPVEVESVTLNHSSLNLVPGTTANLVANVLPVNATDKTVTWTTSNPQIATVSENGLVTAIAVGDAVITAKAGNVTATCAVKVAVVEAASVTLSNTTLDMHVGDISVLTATVAPTNTTDKTVTWSSDNEAVATVDASGKVTAIAIGKAVITAKCGNASASCQVSVNPIEATSVRLNHSAISMNIGDTRALTATVQPSNVTDATVVWSSDNEEIATVDQNGLVTAVAVGTAHIKAACGNVSATCLVTVRPVEAASITINVSSMSLHIGDTQTLTATVQPDNTTDKTVVWSSDNEDVATVDQEGKVTAVGIGMASIKATCGDAQAICVVTVGAVDATDVKISEENVTLHVGDSHQLTATLEPDNVTYPIIVWTSSDPNVATVDAEGMVNAVGAGTAVITAACSNVSASCTVEVLPIEASEVVLSATELTLLAGDHATLTATVLPENATDKTVTWATSDAEVVTVDDAGHVTAISAGTANITATAGVATAVCVVTVNPLIILPESMWISQTTLTMNKGDIYTISAGVNPSNVTDPTIVWTTEDAEIATVSQYGTITAIAIGETNIVASCGDLSISCHVVVAPVYPEQVVLDPADNIYVEEGMTIKVNATVLPDDTTDKTLTWTITDESIATVDQEGNVTGVAEGQTVLTVNCCDYAFAYAWVNVTKKEDGIFDVVIEGKDKMDVYNLQGVLVRPAAKDLNGLPRGVYVIDGKKVYVK